MHTAYIWFEIKRPFLLFPMKHVLWVKHKELDNGLVFVRNKPAAYPQQQPRFHGGQTRVVPAGVPAYVQCP